MKGEGGISNWTGTKKPGKLLITTGLPLALNIYNDYIRLLRKGLIVLAIICGLSPIIDYGKHF